MSTVTFPLLWQGTWLADEYETRSIPDIAREVGCTNPTVLRAMKARNIPTRSPGEGRRRDARQRRARVKITEATEMYQAGASLGRLASRYNVSIPTVKRELLSAGVAVRTQVEQKALERRSTGLRDLKLLIGSDGVCAFCGEDGSVERHHLNGDRSDGRKENLVPLCMPCHRKIEWFIGKVTNGLRGAYVALPSAT